MSVYAVIPAAGVGKRFGSELPKQYHQLGGRTVLAQSILKLQACSEIRKIWVALDESDQHWQSIDAGLRDSVKTVFGGAERSDSVRNALAAMSAADPSDWVVVHDAVRPMVSSALISKLISSLDTSESGAILAVPIHDTIKQVGANHQVEKTLDRRLLWAAQTPQVFRFGLLKDALEKTKGDDRITDEASAMEACGYPVRLFEGHRNNIKITCREDLVLADHMLSMETI